MLEEYRDGQRARRQRATWPKRRLEEAGVSLFGTAAPHSELFGEKIARRASGENSRVREQFTRGDVLTLTFDAAAAAGGGRCRDGRRLAHRGGRRGGKREGRGGAATARVRVSAPRQVGAARAARGPARRALAGRCGQSGRGRGEPRDRPRRRCVRRAAAPPRWRRGGGVRGNPRRGDGADVGARAFATPSPEPLLMQCSPQTSGRSTASRGRSVAP